MEAENEDWRESWYDPVMIDELAGRDEKGREKLVGMGWI